MAKKKKDSMDIDLSRKKKKVFDVDTNIKVAFKTGEIIHGKNEVLKNLRENKYKMIIVANNCPQDILSEINHYNNLLDDDMFIYKYRGSSWDLGLALAKPYMISILGIYDYGDSALEQLKSKKN
jgi:large subunit ribosomal protein L30e